MQWPEHHMNRRPQKRCTGRIDQCALAGKTRQTLVMSGGALTVRQRIERCGGAPQFSPQSTINRLGTKPLLKLSFLRPVYIRCEIWCINPARCSGCEKNGE
ncbi:hypothetical protein SAMN05444358_1011668 [Ruegeria halocynthiae]|uniref:Uncharacterized protein n=1 Tax=Ruegeria halocynthiae TaxID=985054 RepID=A0A1H2W5C7_9RHOB|nr:hypothetical protein SAMN05444358_1011668 [Ruegeria halocynthiae]